MSRFFRPQWVPADRPDASAELSNTYLHPTLLEHLASAVAAQQAPPPSLSDLVGTTRNGVVRQVQSLMRLVGGIEALIALDDEPLRWQPPDWDAVDRSVALRARPVINAILTCRPSWAAERDNEPWWLDDETRAIATTLVLRAAALDLKEWRSSPNRLAAAFVWLALGGSARLGVQYGKVTERELAAWYGESVCGALARRLCMRAGLGELYDISTEWWSVLGVKCVFGDPSLLHSSLRGIVVRHRERAMDFAMNERALAPAGGLVRPLGDGMFAMRVRPVVPLWSAKTLADNGKAAVMVAHRSDHHFDGRDDGVDDDADAGYEIVAMSVPAAHELMSMLQRALHSKPLSPG